MSPWNAFKFEVSNNLLSTFISPLVGFNKPIKMFTNVLLPSPELPMIPIALPLSIFKLIRLFYFALNNKA
mgnify:CR=1 FL=1